MKCANNMSEGTRVKVEVVGGVVMKQDGKYLLVQEATPDIRGLWNCPAGKVDVGFTIEQTAVKEAKEESGYDVELVRKIGIWQESAERAVKHIFEAKIVGGELHVPLDEIMNAGWFTADEVRSMKDKLRSNWVLEVVEMMEKV